MAWPSMRRSETDLVTRVARKVDTQDFAEVFAIGSELSHRQAVALVRDDTLGDGERDGGSRSAE